MKLLSFLSGWILLAFLAIGAEQNVIGTIVNFLSKIDKTLNTGNWMVYLTFIYVIIAILLILYGYFGGDPLFERGD